MNLGNGLRTVSDRGTDGLLTSRRLFKADGTNLSRLTYRYDADGNVTRINDLVDPSRTRLFHYDLNGRLSRTDVASGSTQRVDYVHDANGNRLREKRRALPTDPAPLESDVYSVAAGTNRLTAIAAPSGTRSFGYDNRGNIISEVRPGGGTIAIAYDAFGRLTSYNRTGQPSLVHAYNGLDDRVATTSGSDVRRFVYDPDGRVIGEYGASASDVKAEFIWMSPQVANGGSPFGGDDGVGGYAPLAVAVANPAGGTAINWVYGNHLGVPLVTTDNGGNLAAPADYAAPGFPGQSRTFSDLFYNRYRDFDPGTGRYIQADPIGLDGGLNPYQYALGNPVRYTDPQGKIVPLVMCAVGALVGEERRRSGNMPPRDRPASRMWRSPPVSAVSPGRSPPSWAARWPAPSCSMGRRMPFNMS